jgi:hypothetical protein
VSELKAMFRDRPIVEVQTPQPVAAMRELDAMSEVEKTSIFGTAVHAVLRSTATSETDVAARLSAAGIEVSAIGRVEPSLEDVFLDVAMRKVA